MPYFGPKSVNLIGCVNIFVTLWAILLNWATFSGHTGVAECDKTNLRRGGELVEDVVVSLLRGLSRDP